MIVRFPDGTRVTASALEDRRDDLPGRDFGSYMDPRWAPTWDADLIDWPDFGVPSDEEKAAAQIVNAFQRAKDGDGVEVGCYGGIGRTGTVLACMAILAGVPAEDAVTWVRSHYHPNAVENSNQEKWVLWFGTWAV
jgi:hypothetical protein